MQRLWLLPAQLLHAACCQLQCNTSSWCLAHTQFSVRRPPWPLTIFPRLSLWWLQAVAHTTMPRSKGRLQVGTMQRPQCWMAGGDTRLRTRRACTWPLLCCSTMHCAPWSAPGAAGSKPSVQLHWSPVTLGAIRKGSSAAAACKQWGSPHSNGTATALARQQLMLPRTAMALQQHGNSRCYPAGSLPPLERAAVGADL